MWKVQAGRIGSTITAIARRTTPGLLACAAVIALGASQAGGAPTARPAAATAMIGTATNVSGPDDKSNPVVQIEGRITAPGHKPWHRRCRVARTVFLDAVRVSGAVRPESHDSSNKSGRFDYGSFALDYGGTASDGRFYDGHIPWSGGKVTFLLRTGKVSVAKDRRGFRSYTCPALRLTLEASFPPYPYEI